MRPRAFKATLLLSALAAACKGGDGIGPGSNGLRMVGTNLTDTVMARPAQGLIVELRDDDGGVLANTTVRFDVVPTTIPGRTFEVTMLVAPEASQTFNTFAAVTTNERGRAIVVLRFGTIAGTAKIAVSVPDLGKSDTARYTVLPGNATGVSFTTRDTVVRPGATYPIGAAGKDRFGNRRPNDVISFTAGPSVASVDAAGVVTAGAVGRGYVVATIGAAKDTARFSVVPVGQLLVTSVQSGAPVIATVDLDGSNYQVMASVTGSEFYPKWNRQGTKVLFQWTRTDGSHLYVVTPGGAPQRLLDASAGFALETFGRFAADGNSVYCTGRPAVGAAYALNLYRVTLGTNAPEYVGPGTPGLDFEYHPGPSPDDTRVIFSTGSTMKLLDPATHQVVRDYATNGAMPHFSPDGTRIAYISPQGALMVMNPDGSGKRNVSTGRFYVGTEGFDWSPDSRWLVIRGPGGLELFNVQSGELLPLTYSSALYQPAFHP